MTTDASSVVSPPTPALTASSSSSASANAAFAQDGSLTVAMTGVSLRLIDCRKQAVSPTVTQCVGDAYLDIQIGRHSTRVMFTSIFVDAEATLYRGPLDASSKQNGHSFILSDIDGDGHEDLIVWSGRDGAYGGPSYDVLLFDAATQSFEAAPALSELTVGANGLFTIEDGQLRTSSSDGCCFRVFDTYAIANREPMLVERTTEERPDGSKPPITKTERRIGGVMKAVEAD